MNISLTLNTERFERANPTLPTDPIADPASAWIGQIWNLLLKDAYQYPIEGAVEFEVAENPFSVIDPWNLTHRQGLTPSQISAVNSICQFRADMLAQDHSPFTVCGIWEDFEVAGHFGYHPKATPADQEITVLFC